MKFVNPVIIDKTHTYNCCLMTKLEEGKYEYRGLVTSIAPVIYQKNAFFVYTDAEPFFIGAPKYLQKDYGTEWGIRYAIE